MKWFNPERICWILLLILLTIITYNIGIKIGSVHEVRYITKPSIIETLQVIREHWTEAKIDTTFNPPIIMDSLVLDNIYNGMYAKFESKPIYDSQHNLKYLTKWEHNIVVVKELTQLIDTFVIEREKTTWKIILGSFGGGCLIGYVGGLFTLVNLKI